MVISALLSDSEATVSFTKLFNAKFAPGASEKDASNLIERRLSSSDFSDTCDFASTVEPDMKLVAHRTRSSRLAGIESLLSFTRIGMQHKSNALTNTLKASDEFLVSLRKRLLNFKTGIPGRMGSPFPLTTWIVVSDTTTFPDSVEPSIHSAESLGITRRSNLYGCSSTSSLNLASSTARRSEIAVLSRPSIGYTRRCRQVSAEKK